MLKRPPKILYYLELARVASRRSSCLNKQWGAIIVKDDAVVSTGYNGSPRGCVNCIDTGECARLQAGVQRGGDYNICASTHAEANAIIFASYHLTKGATMYVYGYDVVAHNIVDHPDSCMVCKRMIINAGIVEVIYADVNGLQNGSEFGIPYGYTAQHVSDWIVDRSKIMSYAQRIDENKHIV